MFGPDHDIRLPWQFVLLAFLAFVGLFVGMMVYFSYADSSGMSGSMVRGLRAFGMAEDADVAPGGGGIPA